MESCQALTEALREFPGTVIFVSHDERIISELAERLVVFEGGHISLMETDYAGFLESGGWADEETFKPVTIKRTSVNKADYLERKEQNKAERAKRKALQKLEKSIAKMELKQEGIIAKLNLAYEENNTKNMLDYGAKAKQMSKDIEAAYAELLAG
jgi:ATP-binding cassette subfamily F protein 3